MMTYKQMYVGNIILAIVAFVFCFVIIPLMIISTTNTWEQSRKEAEAKALIEGKNAYRAGLDIDDNPHEDGLSRNDRRTNWATGWVEAALEDKNED